jgi:adenylylsulfate kinase
MERTDVVWHQHQVARSVREDRFGHHGCVVWFTGLSGCGKSTIANLVDHQLFELNVRSFVLDGDNIRHGLNASPEMLARDHGEVFAARFGLGFSAQDREENIRRIGAVAELFAEAGVIVLVAFVSPYQRDRDAVRQKVEAAGRAGDFVEVFVDAPLDVCEARDPKGLYRKARSGELRGFTGIDDPYEPPRNPELTLDSAQKAPGRLAAEVVQYLQRAGLIFSPR